MSLDEFSRKLEKGGNATSTEIAELKQIMSAFFSKKGIDLKTRIPDADAYTDAEVLIRLIGIRFGPSLAELLSLRLERFRVNALSQTGEYIPSRDEVRDMVKSQREKKEENKGKSILERLNSGDY